jgi:hypothetical protein
MGGIVDAQLEQLRERFGDAHIRRLASGTALVTVPSVRLPEGWSKPSTSIRFLVPPGYPYAQLDCFWAEADLRLSGGAMPQNSGLTPIPEANEPGLWFSWHLCGTWNPNRDTLLSWMNVVIDRTRRAL